MCERNGCHTLMDIPVEKNACALKKEKGNGGNVMGGL
jgi:hypothetical protein